MEYRDRLGLDETTPLIGVFGFLKPYKRIAESLRAFRRLTKIEPRARMILVGEEHPDFPVRSLIRTLDLTERVRVISFAPLEDFAGYMAACDIVLNLRYPTVGESSGSLMRALGLGKAVIVSDVGGFREFPDDVCLKAPVDSTEEDVLFEYLNTLVSRPDLAQHHGSARPLLRAAGVRLGSGGSPLCFLPAIGGRGKGMAGRTGRGGDERGRCRRAGRPAIFSPGRRKDRRASTSKRTSPGSRRLSPSRRRAAPPIAFSKWAPICKSLRRCGRAWDMEKCAAATTASSGRSIIAP